MKKILFIALLLSSFLFEVHAQVKAVSDSSSILILNQQIDNYVVQANIPALQYLYADDFVFSHGSGRVEGKDGWFKSVAKGSFLLRQHDSVTVELHPGIAIARGKLMVRKQNAANVSKYQLKYIRVFAKRNNKWKLISHVTFWEYHEPA